MKPTISNTLIQFKRDFVINDNISGVGYEKVVVPIQKCVDSFKKELATQGHHDTIITSTYYSATRGLIVEMYAYSK